jgi:hypothetical protein
VEFRRETITTFLEVVMIPNGQTVPRLPKIFFPLLFLVASPATSQVTVQSFEGVDAVNDAGYIAVDPNGAVGTKQYLEWVNAVYQGYDKVSFAPVYPSPVPGDTPWRQNNMSDCYGANDDGVILFDHLASRWIIANRMGTSTYFYCIAVSNTDNLTASGFAWYSYELALNTLLGQNSQGHAYFPDYPKIASWPDAYYVSIDLLDPDRYYLEVGVLVCAFDRTNMLSGGAARTPQCFRYPNPPSGLFLAHSLLPADIDGKNAPPNGLAEDFVSIQNPQSGVSSSILNLWQFHVNWATPANSTFTGPFPVNVPSYIPGCLSVSGSNGTVCVPEPSTSTTGQYINSYGDRLMHRFAYRRSIGTSFGGYLIAHTVQVGSQTGIRWYELGPGGSLLSSGTISPSDSNYRFMPSVATDNVGNLAVGYSVSGTALHPSISSSYLNLPSNTSSTEFNIITGSADEENSFHWGDYTSMTIDPVDDCTFWYVTEYYTTNQTSSSITWQTRIANFKISNCS